MRFWKKTLLFGALACGAPLSTAYAQQIVALPNDDIRQRLDAQDAELRRLRAQVEGLPVVQPAQASNASFEAASLDAAATVPKPDAKIDPCCEVGKDLSMKVYWNPANGLTFETPCKDFVAHIGFRFQYDVVGFDESATLRNSTKFGEYQDGTFFRRIRPSWDGTAYDVMEWNCEIALEQIQNSVPNEDQMWVGMKDIPVLGSVRIGHQRTPQGFEGDTNSSSKSMTFLERAAYTDAFYENFATGLWQSNTYCDEHMTLTNMVYRQDNPFSNSAIDFADGKFGYSSRLTALPFYQDDGRHLLHLGLSGTYRLAEDVNPAAGAIPGSAGGPPSSDFRARPQLRDAMGDFGKPPLTGDSSRMVDTGVIRCDSNTVIGAEFFYVAGPFSLQAEYAVAYMNDAIIGGVNVGDLPYDGGYAEVSYFLTGENRTYDRRYGTLGSTYIKAPYTNAWAVRDANGDVCYGWGAWEVAARYSHLNLDNDFVRGGHTDAIELGLNWYLNTNLKLQFEYLHQYCDDGGQTGIPSGWIDGFGMRTQFFF